MDQLEGVTVKEHPAMPYVYLHRQWQNLLYMLGFSKSPVVAIGRECTTCPRDGVFYLRLDNTDPHREDVHIAVSHQYGEAAERYITIVDETREKVKKIGDELVAGRFREFAEGCSRYLPRALCDTVVGRLKSALRSGSRKALRQVSELSYVFPLLHVQMFLSRVKDELLCIKFSDFGYLCYQSSKERGIVEASAVEKELTKFLDAIGADYVKLEGAELEKFRLFKWLREACRREQQMCALLLQFYIPPADYVKYTVMGLVCVEHRGEVLCPAPRNVENIVTIDKSLLSQL
ncbi:hypothetical protein [Pyrobaculum sp.]|uniref:hypothetical protein n=1 Tax=Pyrobaculum sp. TaxID=2004705 RepID=UPI003D149969